MMRRPLGRPAAQAVPPIREIRQAQAPRRLAGEEVAGDGEVEKMRQPANAGRNLAGELVVGDIELLQARHPPDLLRYRPYNLVEAEIKHGEVLEPADLCRETRPEPVVHEDDLVERRRHVAEARRHAAPEWVVRGDDDGDGRVPDIVGQVGREAVVVDEDGVQVLFEERRRDAALELVEAKVEVLERRQADDHRRELSGEPVVADVELVENPKLAKRLGHNPAESVGIEVKQRKVDEEAELLGEVAGNVAVVEVNASDSFYGGIVERRGAEDAGVVADVGAGPVAGEAQGVGDYGELPRLERDVRVAEAGVGEDEGGVDGDVLAAAAVGVAVGEELPPADELDLGVGETERGYSSGGEGGGGGEVEEEEEEEVPGDGHGMGDRVGRSDGG